MILKIFSILVTFLKISFGSNIGVCGHSVFLEREKILDDLIINLNNNSNFSKIIIDNFGYSGIENLIRYREPSLIHIYKYLLSSTNFYVKFKSIYGIGNIENYYSDEIINKLIKIYSIETNLLLKDMIISTLGRLKRSKVLNELEKFNKVETNIYIKNSIIHSIKILKNEVKENFENFNYGEINEPLKKFLYYKKGDKIDNYKEIYSLVYLYEKDIPTSFEFIPPIIEYYRELIFNTERLSYGVGRDIVHTGDDCGWFREGSSVYAIGDGIVRLIHHSPDWGFLVLIEHKLENGDYICSIYGHLSKRIYIKPGDIVKIGQKIGEIGLSYSVENGGYGAHLHFGISKGRWLKSGLNLGQNLMITTEDGEIKKVKEYKINPNSIEITYENGIKILLEQENFNLSNYLFWLKGYTFSKDIERVWLNPVEFLKNFKK